MRKIIVISSIISLMLVQSFHVSAFSRPSLLDSALTKKPDSSAQIIDSSARITENSKTKIDSALIKKESEPVKKLDKIVKKNGDELNVIIKEKNVFEIKYYTEENKKLQAISTSSVKEIRYADGRLESLDTTPERRSKNWVVGQTQEQTDTTSKTEVSSGNPSIGLDTIVKPSGKKLLAYVVEKNVLEVKYRLPKGKTIYSMNISMVKEIHYADGRIVDVDNNPEKRPKDWTVARAVREWEEVMVTYNQDDVASLVEKGPIEVEFTPDKITATNEFLEKSATVVAKKKASKMKATTVLITEKKFDRQYGELPSIRLKGIAYSKP